MKEMEIILVPSDNKCREGAGNVYALYERFGFKGSWRTDALYTDDYMRTFSEITGLAMENFNEGFIIKPELLTAQQFWNNNVTDMTRIHDMYRLKEWLRLAVKHNVAIAII